MDNTQLGAALTSLGYDVTVHDDFLEIGFAGDEPGETRPAAVSFRGPTSGMQMLMVSTSYPYGATADILDDVRLGAHECTQYLVLGHFEVDDDHSLHLRFSTLLPDADEVPVDQLGQILAVLDTQQQHFGDYLEMLCTGETELSRFAELVAAGEQLDL